MKMFSLVLAFGATALLATDAQAFGKRGGCGGGGLFGGRHHGGCGGVTYAAPSCGGGYAPSVVYSQPTCGTCQGGVVFGQPGIQPTPYYTAPAPSPYYTPYTYQGQPTPAIIPANQPPAISPADGPRPITRPAPSNTAPPK